MLEAQDKENDLNKEENTNKENTNTNNENQEIKIRASRLRPSHCKNCKADTPEPRFVIGIGEMCANCAPIYNNTIGNLIEHLDGQTAGNSNSNTTNSNAAHTTNKEMIFRAIIRTLQQLNYEYRVTGQGKNRKVEIGVARYRPAQMLEIYEANKFNYESLIQAINN